MILVSAVEPSMTNSRGMPDRTHGHEISISACATEAFSVADQRQPMAVCQQKVVDTVWSAACGWFTTVLGQGAEEAHTIICMLMWHCTEQVIVTASANNTHGHRAKLFASV